MSSTTSKPAPTVAPTSNGGVMANHIEHKRAIDHIFDEVDEDILHHGDDETDERPEVITDATHGIINDEEEFDPQAHVNLDNGNNNNNNNNANGLLETIHVARHDFLVSFLVDARGGALNGCRHTGVKVIIPPKTVPQPMRITCRYVKKDALLYPPPLNEGEGLACRILQVGPRGSKFLGSVMIEVPHVASLREGEREVIVLRCDSAAKGKWTEHHQEEEIDEKTLRDLMDDSLSSTASSANSTSTSSPVPRGPLLPGAEGSRSGSRSGPSPTSHHPFSSPGSFHHSPHHHPHPQERPRQVVRILAKEFPQYFAVITRGKQDVMQIGPEGGLLKSSSVAKAQVNIRPKSLIKRVNVGLCAMQIDDANAEEILEQGGSVSPILTIEPRRRKFHRAITLTMPLPARAREQLRRQMGETQRRANRSQSPSVKKTITSSGITKGPIGSISKPTSVLPPDPVEEALTPNKKTPKKKKSKSNQEIADEDEFSKIEMSLRLVCSMSGNYAKACWEDVTESTPMTVHIDDEGEILVKADVTNNYNNGTQPQPQPLQKIGNGPKKGQTKVEPEGSVQFTSIVSASFLLVHCPNWMSCDLISLVDQLHKNVMRVPYFGRFHVYARRNPISSVFANNRGESPLCATPSSPATTPSSSSSGKMMSTSNHIRTTPGAAAHVRILCISEPDRSLNPLELQEDFVEVCRSHFVEIFERAEIDVRFGGNIIQTCRESVSAHGTSSADSTECDGACQEFDYGLGKRVVIFQPFGENRQGFSVRRRNDKNPFAKGTISFVNVADNKVLYEEKIDLTKYL